MKMSDENIEIRILLYDYDLMSVIDEIKKN
jgi:hypothetical protein